MLKEQNYIKAYCIKQTKPMTYTEVCDVIVEVLDVLVFDVMVEVLINWLYGHVISLLRR